MAAHRILDQSRYIDPRRERKRDSGATWRVVPGKFRAYYAELYRELVHKIPDGKAAFIFARADFVSVHFCFANPANCLAYYNNPVNPYRK